MVFDDNTTLPLEKPDIEMVWRSRTWTGRRSTRRSSARCSSAASTPARPTRGALHGPRQDHAVARAGGGSPAADRLGSGEDLHRGRAGTRGGRQVPRGPDETTRNQQGLTSLGHIDHPPTFAWRSSPTEKGGPFDVPGDQTREWLPATRESQRPQQRGRAEAVGERHERNPSAGPGSGSLTPAGRCPTLSHRDPIGPVEETRKLLPSATIPGFMESFEAALDPLHVRSRWGIPALATKSSSLKPRSSRECHVESLQWRALVDCNRSEGAMARRARQAASPTQMRAAAAADPGRGWSGKCRQAPRVIETEPRFDGRTQSSDMCRATDKQTRGGRMTGRWGAAGRSKTEECVGVGRPLVELFAPGLIRPPYVNLRR